MSIFSSLSHFFFGGPQTTNSTSTTNASQTNNPYAPAIPAVNQSITDTQKLFNGGAPQISPLEQSGYDSISAAAPGAQAGVNAATTANSAVASGEYLDPSTNPYLADIAKQISDQTMAQVNGTFGGAGRTGSGLHQFYAGQGVGTALSDFFGAQYDQERGLQQQAIAQAPALASAAFTSGDQLATAGQTVSARPYDINAQYNGILDNIAKLGGSSTGTSTTTGNSSTTPASNGWLLNKLFPSG